MSQRTLLFGSWQILHMRSSQGARKRHTRHRTCFSTSELTFGSVFSVSRELGMLLVGFFNVFFLYRMQHFEHSWSWDVATWSR